MENVWIIDLRTELGQAYWSETANYGAPVRIVGPMAYVTEETYDALLGAFGKQRHPDMIPPGIHPGIGGGKACAVQTNSR